MSGPGKSNYTSFFTHLALVRDRDGEEVLPIIGEDNYFPLLPHEERVITAAVPKGGRRRLPAAAAGHELERGVDFVGAAGAAPRTD